MMDVRSINDVRITSWPVKNSWLGLLTGGGKREAIRNGPFQRPEERKDLLRRPGVGMVPLLHLQANR